MGKVILEIKANEGYDESQVHGSITVGDLKQALEDFDEDAEIVTLNRNNMYGANFGIITYAMYDGCDDEEN